MHAAVLAWFLATAYCRDGLTSAGVHTRAGIVAADSRVVPLGSRVHVDDGRSSGTYSVLDSGRRIRGRKIDVFMKSCRQARKFGKRRVNVTVLRSPRGRP